MTNNDQQLNPMQKMLESNVEYKANGEHVKLTGNMIKKFLVRGGKEVTDSELVMFMQLCKYQQLNPFLNEAYLIKFDNEAQIVVSKEAFMKRAEGHEQYGGLTAGIIVEREGEMKELEGAVKLKSDELLGGWCRVKRKDRESEIVAKVSYEEFGKGQSTWKKMPANMIRKTAIVNALREAFPEKLSSLYTEDDAQLKDITDSKPQDEETAINVKANQTLIDIPEEPVKVTKINKQPEAEMVEAQYKEVEPVEELKSYEDAIDHQAELEQQQVKNMDLFSEGDLFA